MKKLEDILDWFAAELRVAEASLETCRESYSGSLEKDHYQRRVQGFSETIVALSQLEEETKRGGQTDG